MLGTLYLLPPPTVIATKSFGKIALTTYTPPPTTRDITTVAGGEAGMAVATQITQAGFQTAFDSAGNAYIADAGGNYVRRIAAGSDNETIVAGDGYAGYAGDNGPATFAALYEPEGVAVDHSGNLLIADSANSRVRVLAESTGTFYGLTMSKGDIYTIAGNGTSSFFGDNGAATLAELDNPQGLSIDSHGNIVVADMDNNRVRVVAESTGTYWGVAMTAGDIYTVAGGGSSGCSTSGVAGTSASLNNPASTAVDASGNILMGDTLNNCIRVLAGSTGTFYGTSMTAGDVYTIVAGSGSNSCSTNGPASSALLQDPYVSFDTHGNVIIDDAIDNCVRVLAESTATFYGQSMTLGSIYTIAGTGTVGYSGDGAAATSAELDHPMAGVVDGSGNVVVFDSDNIRTRLVAESTGTFYGQSMTSGDIYTIAGDGGAGTGDGALATSSQLSFPHGIAVDGTGDLVVADTTDNRVRMVAQTTGSRFDQMMSAGDIYTVAGTGTAGYSGDSGAATAAEINYPAGVSVDGSGNLVFADSSNNRVRVVAATTGTYYGVSMTGGDIYTVAGTGTAGYSGNAGAATSAKLSDPYDVAIDSHGNLVVADKNTQRIRVVAESSGTYYGISMTSGDIYAVAGNGTASFGGDGGIATSANLNYPKGVSIDPQGNIAISDTLNKRVRVVAGSTGTFYGQSMTVGYIYTVAGTGTAGFTGDGGSATSAELNQPQGVTFDGEGNAVIADTNNQRVRVIAATNGTFYGQQMTSGDIYTVAGSGKNGFIEDGVPATYAQLAYPGGVAVDAAGRLIIADTSDNRIRELSGGPASAALISPIGGAIGMDLHSPSGSYWASQQTASATGSSGTASRPPSGSTSAGSTPVDPASGGFSKSTTDLNLPGAGVPLAYIRTYDSQVAQNEIIAGSAGGALGFGWSSNLGMSLSYNSTTHVATIVEENGAQITFNTYGTQWWCSGAQNFCATAPRTVATLNQDIGGSWTFTRTDGPEQVFTFTSAGVLSSIADAQGDTLTEGTYSPGVGQAPCPAGDGCIAWTSSASGRELVIATKTLSGQVDQVFDPSNATTEIATFAYAGTGCSTWGGSLVPDLCAVSDPSLAASLYTYDSGNSTAAFDYDMLGSTPSGASAQASTSYNSSGLVNRPGFPGGSKPWKGWSHGTRAPRIEAVPA
jgi:hypothetical protein